MTKRPRQRMENQLDWLIQSMTMMSKKMETMEQRIDKIENILSIDLPTFSPSTKVYNLTAEPLCLDNKVSELSGESQLEWNSSLTFRENLQGILISLREENQNWRIQPMDELEAS
jgi:hypothetical protein